MKHVPIFLNDILTHRKIKKKNLREVGFEPTNLYESDLKSNAFNHSAIHAFDNN